ncbi:zinc finger protein 626-like [Culicoides brevitarsis]|uniref:zinc finger protein 626-like n=1 Tax=Culicoides brevitarsis TaxID=469753 RepID=UPI00307C36A2
MPEVTPDSCRICLNEPQWPISLSSTFEVLGKVHSYTELYQNLSGLVLVGTGPQRLCKGCGMNLVQAYELKMKIEESERLLGTLIEQSTIIVGGTENADLMIKEEEAPMDFDFGASVVAEAVVKEEIDEEFRKSEDSGGDDDDDEYTDDEESTTGEHNLRKRPKKKLVPAKKQRKTKRTKQEQQPLSLECSICLKVFTKKFDFRNHYRVLHAPQEIKCPNCTRTFTDADEFDKHVRHGHKKRNREKTLCPHCAKVMLNTSIQEHIKSIHEDNHREYICDLCGVRAKSKDILTGHMKFKHQNLTYNCRYCPETFKNKGTRRTHEIRFHTFNYKHICNICEKKFMTNAQLKKHRVIHTGEKPHSCDICGQRFSFRAGLKDHMATHAETRDFVCEICTNAFKNMKALRKHKAVHEERNYECPVCGQKFLENKTLRAHCSHSHPEYQLPPPGTVMNKKALARVGEILEKYHVHAHHSSVPRKMTSTTTTPGVAEQTTSN